MWGGMWNWMKKPGQNNQPPDSEGTPEPYTSSTEVDVKTAPTIAGMRSLEFSGIREEGQPVDSLQAGGAVTNAMSDLIGKHWRALAITGGAASVVITLWYSRPSKKQRRRATRALAKEAGSVRSVNSISQVTEPTEYGVPSGDPRKVGFAAKRLPTSIDVIIIGSGIGGLACAATLAKSGVKCVVLEQHDVAGGSTHTYESTANGVTVEFDTGLHYVGGKVWLPTTTSSQILNWMSDGGIQWQLMDNIYDIAVFNGERIKCPRANRL